MSTFCSCRKRSIGCSASEVDISEFYEHFGSMNAADKSTLAALRYLPTASFSLLPTQGTEFVVLN